MLVMQLQSISSQSPNVISITQVREDIDVLTKALAEFGRVRVLRGQKILFDAIDPEFEEKRRESVKRAVAQMMTMAKKYKGKKGEISGTEWIIRERDRMRTKKYYDEHHR